LQYEKWLRHHLTFQTLDCTLAFFWIEEGKSWIGLWEGAESRVPYHVSLRHIAFYVELDDIKKAKN